MGLFTSISDFFGASDRKNAEKYGDLADESRAQMQTYQQNALDTAGDRFDAESGFVNSEQDRFNSIYAPMEQSLADELNAGPQSAQAAAIAGGEFTGQFDASTASRDRALLRQGVSYQPGSSASRMQGENDAYNRARGIAGAQTEARREEEDSHFLKQNAFFQANSNSIQNRVQNGIASAYGADYNAQTNAAAQQAEQATYNQGVSNQYAEQSKAGINTLVNIGGRIAAGVATGGASELALAATNSFSDGAATQAAQPQSSATGQYLNNYTPNQAQAAIAGTNTAYYNNNFGS